MISTVRLFIYIFVPSLVALLAGFSIFKSNMEAESRKQFLEFMQTQWAVASKLDTQDYASIKELVSDTNLRLTLVDESGKVLMDSSVADSNLMDMHNTREEVRSAAAGVPVMTVRMSDSTHEHSLYYARQLPSGKVLRVAFPSSFYDYTNSSVVRQAYTSFITLVLLVGVFALVLSALMRLKFQQLGEAVEKAENGGDDLPSFDHPHIDKALASLSNCENQLKNLLSENIDLNAHLRHLLNSIKDGVILIKNGELVYTNTLAREMLGGELPKHMSESKNIEMIRFFTHIKNSGVTPINVNGRVINTYITAQNGTTVVILCDDTDSQLYIDYKADLVGNLSHELKTPLALILGASETVMKDPEMPVVTQRKFLNTIHKNSVRVNNLIDEMVLLHRIEHGKLEDYDGEVDINELISELACVTDSSDKKLHFNITDSKIAINPIHLTSILNNLISNAVKYSSGADVYVDISVRNNLLQIDVADLGPAIDAKYHGRIFERFYSISASRGGTGSGLGLSIVKHIAKLYCGSVSLKSNKMGGNTFSVQLPIGKF